VDDVVIWDELRVVVVVGGSVVGEREVVELVEAGREVVDEVLLVVELLEGGFEVREVVEEVLLDELCGTEVVGVVDVVREVLKVVLGLTVV
jgi:hypothetical protein